MDQIGSYVYLLYNSFPVQLPFTQCKGILHIFLPLLRHFGVRYSSKQDPGLSKAGISLQTFLFRHSHFDFCVIYLLLQKANTIFDVSFFLFPTSPRADPRPTTASWRSRAARPGTARGFSRGTPEPQEAFPTFPGDSRAVSLNHTTYPAVILAFQHWCTFLFCLHQPIPTEF